MSYRTKARPAKLSKYRLRLWSNAVRRRDGFICCVCLERIFPGYKADAHHVRPKALYPELAYNLSNGVTVCSKHHQPCIHTTRLAWQRWVSLCRSWLRE